MTTIYLNLFLLISNFSFYWTIENDCAEKINTIISKVIHKKYISKMDTLWVSQTDTTIFERKQRFATRPCSKPTLVVYYELINPKDGVYYLIYNDKKQLVIEGEYTAEYTYEGKTYKQGNFYNSKMYYYKKNGNLETIHYQEDGRNLKVEYFDNKKRLTEITYTDKKSDETTKIEIYKKGRLKKTLIYVNYRKYRTVKANR